MLYRAVMGIKRRFWLRHYKQLPLGGLGKSSVLDNRISFSGEQYITIGENCFIGAESTISCFDRYGSDTFTPCIRISDHVTFTRRATIYCTNRVEIGEYTLIGSDVLITDENHGLDPRHSYRENNLVSKPVIIGKNVWIGDKAVILPGVVIGDNAIVGAGAIVTKSISAYSICAGNPARVIKTWNSDKECWDRV